MFDNVLGFLGILFRANKALIGEEARSSKKGKLAFLASDASENTKKETKTLTDVLPTLTTYTKSQLGSALGYEGISFILIVDKKAANSLLKKRKETL